MKIDKDYDHFISIKVGVNGNNMESEIFTQIRVSKSKKVCNIVNFDYNITYSDIEKFFKGDTFRDTIINEIKKALNNDKEKKWTVQNL